MARKSLYGSEENKTLLEANELKCEKCEKTFSLSNFYKDKYALSGYKPVCKPCACARSKGYRVKYTKNNIIKIFPENIFCPGCKHTKSIKEFHKDKGRKNGIRPRCKACFKLNLSAEAKEKTKWRMRKKLYGITKEKYNELLIEQKCGCAICKKTNDKRPLVPDHNHRTGKVRGLLCHNCNGAIGLFGDNITACKNAALYLEERGSYGS